MKNKKTLNKIRMIKKMKRIMKIICLVNKKMKKRMIRILMKIILKKMLCLRKMTEMKAKKSINKIHGK